MIQEIVACVYDVARGRGLDFTWHSIKLYQQVVICLMLLRQNMFQMVIADLYGVSQPSRQRRRLPLAAGGLRMLAAPAVGGASGGVSCAVERGSTGVFAPSESPAGQVSTSLPLAPPK